jgi:hypothetical protein
MRKRTLNQPELSVIHAQLKLKFVFRKQRKMVVISTLLLW